MCVICGCAESEYSSGFLHAWLMTALLTTLVVGLLNEDYEEEFCDLCNALMFTGSRFQGAGLRFQGAGFTGKTQGSGFRVQGTRFQGAGFTGRTQAQGSRFQGAGVQGFRVQGFKVSGCRGSRVQGAEL